MKRQCFLWCLLAFFPGLSLFAQNATLELGRAEAKLGSAFEIPLLLTTDAPVAGFTIACEWDGFVATGVELRNLAVGPDHIAVFHG